MQKLPNVLKIKEYIYMKSTYTFKNSVYDTFKDPFSSSQVSTNSSFMASFVTKTLRWNKNFVLNIKKI